MDKKCEVCGEGFNFAENDRKKRRKTCGKPCAVKMAQINAKKKHPPVEKVCATCGETYQDTTKRKVGSYCSKKCQSTDSVSIRNSNGSYERTQQQNERLSKTLKEKYASGEMKKTDEEKEMLSQKLKDYWASGKMKELSEKACMERYGVRHHSQTEEARKANRERPQKPVSEETRRRMSISQSARVRSEESKQHHYTYGNGGKREDIGNTYFRSNWEANFARICDYNNKEWEYETKTFALSNGRNYTPDFLIEGVYYEIKGRWTEKARNQVEMFQKDYPEIRLDVIDESCYIILRKRYKHLINKWEGK